MNAFCQVFRQKITKNRPFEKRSSLGKKLKNALESFLRHMFLVFVSQHVWGGVGNFAWPSQGLRGAYERKNPIGTRLSRFGPLVASKFHFEVCFLKKKQVFFHRYAFSSWKSSS
jgi:hypothetical protein